MKRKLCTFTHSQRVLVIEKPGKKCPLAKREKKQAQYILVLF